MDRLRRSRRRCCCSPRCGYLTYFGGFGAGIESLYIMLEWNVSFIAAKKMYIKAKTCLLDGFGHHCKRIARIHFDDIYAIRFVRLSGAGLYYIPHPVSARQDLFITPAQHV